MAQAWLYLWIVRTTGLSYNDQARSTGVVKSDALQSVHQTIRTRSHHWFRPLTVMLGTIGLNVVYVTWKCKQTYCVIASTFSQNSNSNWIKNQVNQVSHHSLPDSAYVAGTTFSCALIEDNWELHLIPGLELKAILDFFYMKEQLLALTNFICDEAKLGGTKQLQHAFTPA